MGAKRKPKAKAPPDEAVGGFIAQHARYTRTQVYIPPMEGNDNAGWFHVSRNADINLLDAWITTEGGFDGRDLRTAQRCRDLWDRMPRPTHRISEAENYFHAKAAKALCALKRSVPRHDWEIFENAMRWNEPGGYLGSRFLEPRESRVKDTQQTVKRVLRAIT